MVKIIKTKPQRSSLKIDGSGGDDYTPRMAVYDEMYKSVFGFTFLSTDIQHTLCGNLLNDFNSIIAERKKDAKGMFGELKVDEYIMFRFRVPVLHSTGVYLCHYDFMDIKPYFINIKEFMDSITDKSIRHYNEGDLRQSAVKSFTDIKIAIEDIKFVSGSTGDIKPRVMEVSNFILHTLSQYCAVNNINFISLLNNFSHQTRI